MSEFNINEDAQSGGEFSGGSQSSNQGPSSSSQQQPVESAFPDEDEETITMLDVIEQEDKLEEEASAVLGNSDEMNCTYPKGYISRQALYSCTTCSQDPNNMAAICLACSLECHDNHEVIELYTKRNYRCDCGNSKFKPDFGCKLMDKQTKKAHLNEQNKYNHNFAGRYCVCDKRYPPDENDDSVDSQDEMWQCIVCEDWYHSRHLGSKELPSKFDELICGACVDKLEFVHYYRNVLDETSNDNSGGMNPKLEAATETATATTTDDGAKLQSEKPQGDRPANATTTATTPTANESTDSMTNSTGSSATSQQQTNNSPSKQVEIKTTTPTVVSESDTNDSQLENKDPSQTQSSNGNQATSALAECLLEKLKLKFEQQARTGSDSQSAETEPKKKAAAPIFWPDCSWRSKLCRCPGCLSMYKVKECDYLLDDKDTVQYYEAQGRAIAKDRATPFERGMSALNQMNRAAVVEALHGYDELKADLSTYLRKFADNKKVVREEDIHDFFAQLKSKKRPRFEYE